MNIPDGITRLAELKVWLPSKMSRVYAKTRREEEGLSSLIKILGRDEVRPVANPVNTFQELASALANWRVQDRRDLKNPMLIPLINWVATYLGESGLLTYVRQSLEPGAGYGLFAKKNIIDTPMELTTYGGRYSNTRVYGDYTFEDDTVPQSPIYIDGEIGFRLRDQGRWANRVLPEDAQAGRQPDGVIWSSRMYSGDINDKRVILVALKPIQKHHEILIAYDSASFVSCSVCTKSPTAHKCDACDVAMCISCFNLHE